MIDHRTCGIVRCRHDHDDVHDIEAILAITNSDPDEVLHAVSADVGALFTWDYGKGARPALDKLYEKAKASAVERVDRPRLVDRRRPRAHGGRARRARRPA